MIKKKEIENWYSSSHYRKKCDWICIDQPKVIYEWEPTQIIGQVVYSKHFEIPEWLGHIQKIEVAHDWIEEITKKPSSSGCIAIIKRPHFPLASLYSAKKIVILDGIQDPGNLGTIIRSMVAFGVSNLCLTKDCVDPFHPKVISASVGSITKLCIFFEQHWAPWIKQAKLPMFVLDPRAKVSISDMQGESENDFIVVCGSEGKGVIKDCFNTYNSVYPISIPMNEECESLNAAMALNIALYKLTEK